MNATRWVTLTEFVKHLGRSGIARVDETEKGWFLAWVDNSPQALAKQVSLTLLPSICSILICILKEAAQKKERLTMSDEQRERLLIAEQIERAAAEGGAQDDEQEKAKAVEEGLKRDQNAEKVVLSLSLKPSVSSSTSEATPAAAPLKINPLKGPSIKSTTNSLKRPNVFKSSPLASGSSSKAKDETKDNSKKRPLSALESIIMEEEERKRRKVERETRA